MYSNPLTYEYMLRDSINPTGIFAMLGLTLFLTVFLLVCEWKIYKKLNKPGWACLIPVYCNFVLFDSLWTSKAFVQFLLFVIIGMVCEIAGLLFMTIIPLLGLVLLIVTIIFIILELVWSIRLINKLSNAFGHGGAFTFGLLFLPLIFYPILAFSKTQPTIQK